MCRECYEYDISSQLHGGCRPVANMFLKALGNMSATAELFVVVAACMSDMYLLVRNY